MNVEQKTSSLHLYFVKDFHNLESNMRFSHNLQLRVILNNIEKIYTWISYNLNLKEEKLCCK